MKKIAQKDGAVKEMITFLRNEISDEEVCANSCLLCCAPAPR